MQSLRVKKGSLQSIVHVPTSKSYANRALILSALSKEKVELIGLPSADDVAILMRCLKQVGLDITTKDDSYIISNSFPECETNGASLEVGEGGTTARFIATMLLLGTKEYTLELGERLKDRPWKEFIDLVTFLGGTAKLFENKLMLKGPITFPNLIEIDCSKTTQFATAFQLIAPGSTIIKPINLHSSQSYWKMNEVICHDIKANKYRVPTDWSSASYPMAFAALNQKIFFPGLFYDEFQADSKFLSILKIYEAASESSLGINVGVIKKELNLNFDVSDCLDLVPTLGYFLAHVKGRHCLNGITNLIHKESDRITGVMRLLAIFGRTCEIKGTTLIIHGHHQIIQEEKNLIMPNDHRMVMVGTLFLLHHHGGTISPSDAVNKSYPQFFEILSLPSEEIKN
jgi:3-phosphoshikimate 1-carboxyvinyltransferase